MDPDTVAALRAAGETDPHIGADGRVPHGSSDDPSLLDFSANTNQRVPPGTREVFEESFDTARAYPNDGYPDFRGAVAEFVGCDPGEVVPTAGGLEAIRLAIGTTVRAGESVLLPAPSFGEYAREVRLQGGEPTFVGHDAILDADPDDYAMAVVCNPNNPTGECYDADALREFADRCGEVGTTLLVDEDDVAQLDQGEQYRLVTHPDRSSDLAEFIPVIRDVEETMTRVTVEADGPLEGEFAGWLPVSVPVIDRDDTPVPFPTERETLQAGDVAYVIGTPSDIARLDQYGADRASARAESEQPREQVDPVESD